MRLVQPTDFEILEQLTDGHRNNAINLAVLLDQNRAYINTRLPVLADYGLVERVGPAQKSGLYAITDRGHAAVACRETYTTGGDFEAALTSYLDEPVEHL
ncbi:ArsR family transcriptional regulator [Halorubrum sp. N11]|uniref:ArsR family transcriptional regulator n=1 Tax=Halorubrum sp. N11 TaxID=3402276 RepID=UPI003EBAB9AA